MSTWWGLDWVETKQAVRMLEGGSEAKYTVLIAALIGLIAFLILVRAGASALAAAGITILLGIGIGLFGGTLSFLPDELKLTILRGSRNMGLACLCGAILASLGAQARFRNATSRRP